MLRIILITLIILIILSTLITQTIDFMLFVHHISLCLTKQVLSDDKVNKYESKIQYIGKNITD